MPSPPTLDEQIRTVLAIDPEAGAIEFEGRWTTWGELAKTADAVAAELDSAGLGEGAAVGVALRNAPEMIGAALGVLGSRRCVVTINPHLGATRLTEDLAELALPALIAADEDWGGAAPLRAGFANGDVALSIGRGGGVSRIEAKGPARSAPAHAPLPNVAVQMLTSGTTGKPKRIELHRSALEHSLIGAKHYERAEGAPEAPRLRSGVAILNAPLVHIGGLWRALQCIADGRSFALLDKFRVEPWTELVRRHQPKTVSLVPAALRMVLESEIDPSDLTSIKAVVSGTAPLPPEDGESFEERFGIPVLTSYGATEFAGGVAGWNLADHRKLRKAKRGSVGRAHPGCELRIVEAGSPSDAPVVLAPGEEGLLEVRSSQLGPHSGWVRTTDRARMDEDGFLWIVGRADSAILRGGFKIHPDEVRAALEAHPDVREAAVVGLPDDRLGHVPVAAVELREGCAETPSEDALKAFAGERLTRYQIPAQVRVVSELPRTPSLKVSQPGVRALFE